MLTVVANKTEALVTDDRRKIYMNVTREEAKRITSGKVCVWKDREILYTARDYYIEIGFELVDNIEEEKEDALRKNRYTCANKTYETGSNLAQNGVDT